MIEEAFLSFCNTHGIHNCSVAVAVSGGSDSISLMQLFHTYKDQLNLTSFGVIHINHNLRSEESQKEELFIREEAKKCACLFHYKKLFGKTIEESGIEEWARTERYAFFDEIKQRFSYDYIAVAHNLNDQTETVLMNIMRGTGLLGLEGMKPVRDGFIIRPLLMVEKNEIERWLQNRGNKWYIDSSNEDTRFKRNQVRHQLIPLLNEMAQGINQKFGDLTTLIQQQNRFCEKALNDHISRSIYKYSASYMVIHNEIFCKDSFLMSEGAVLLLRQLFISFDRKTVSRLIEGVKNETGEFLLGSGWHGFSGRDCTVIKRINTGIPSFKTVALRPNNSYTIDSLGIVLRVEPFCREGETPYNNDATKGIFYLDNHYINGNISLRAVRNDDTIIPFGKDKPVPVMKLLKKRKISHYFRSLVTVIVDDDDTVLAIPTVLISEKARVSEKSECIIKISSVNISAYMVI